MSVVETGTKQKELINTKNYETMYNNKTMESVRG